MRPHWILAIGILVIASAAPARAQGPYVGASLTGDIVRLTHSETEGVLGTPDGGEAIGFALRVGTPIGSKWGIDAEFARPSKIDDESRPDVVALDTLAPQSLIGGQLAGIVYPPISYQIRTSLRNTTFSTTAWVQQDLSPRFALVYLGGIGFHRTERDFEFSYGPVPFLPSIPLTIPITIPASQSGTVTYSAHPVIGVDGRIGMSRHIDLVPGARLHGLKSGVLIRPFVGLEWKF